MLRRCALAILGLLFVLSGPAEAKDKLEFVDCLHLENAHRTGTSGAGIGSDTIELEGPGCFISANVTRQGDGSGLTELVLSIDGQIVVNRTFEALFNQGMTTNNPFGVMLNQGNTPGLQAVSIGFPQPLFFAKSLVLEIDQRDSGVTGFSARVISAE